MRLSSLLLQCSLFANDTPLVRWARKLFEFDAYMFAKFEWFLFLAGNVFLFAKFECLYVLFWCAGKIFYLVLLSIFLLPSSWFCLWIMLFLNFFVLLVVLEFLCSCCFSWISLLFLNSFHTFGQIQIFLILYLDDVILIPTYLFLFVKTEKINKFCLVFLILLI